MLAQELGVELDVSRLVSANESAIDEQAKKVEFYIHSVNIAKACRD